jgi:hypothetical protein
VFAKLGEMESSDTVTARRAARKQAQLATARACGARLARAHPGEADPAKVLEDLAVAGFTPAERRAKAGLLPATWRAAFTQGWRGANSATQVPDRATSPGYLKPTATPPSG